MKKHGIIIRLVERFGIAGLTGPAIAAGLIVWVTWGLWANGIPVGDDMAAHVIRAEYAIKHFIAHGRLDGWQPSFALGYQQHLFIGPVLSWLTATVCVVSFGTMEIVAAFKAVLVGMLAFLPVATAYLARSFKLDNRSAGIAAILTLAVNNPFGGAGLHGLFVIGLAANLPGAVFFCFALGALLRLVDEPSWRRMAVAAAPIALLAATHGISMILLCFLAAILLALIFVEWGADALLKRNAAAKLSIPRHMASTAGWLAAAFLAAFALSAWILVPLAAHYDLRGMITDWGHTPLRQRIVDIWNGRILFAPGIAPWVLAGAVYGIWRVVRGCQFALPLLAAPVLFMLLGELFFSISPDNVLGRQIPNRGLGYAGLLSIIGLAALLADATRRLRLIGDVIALAASLYLVVIPLQGLRSSIRTVTPAPVAFAAADELSRVVPEGARYVMQRDFPDEIRNIGMTHPDFWMAWRSGRNTLNVFNVESSITPDPAFYAEHMMNDPPEQAADKLSRYGVTHVLLVNKNAAASMLSSPRFRVVWESPPMAILSVVPAEGQPDPGSLISTSVPAQAALVNPGAEHLKISVNALTNGLATAAVAWSPKWHASIDNIPIKLDKTPEGLLSFGLPAGSHIITLDYRADLWDASGKAVSAIAVVAIFMLLLRGKMRKLE